MELPWWFSGKESVSKAGDAGDSDLMPGLGRSLGGENGKSNILAWRIPGTEEPSGLQ